MATKGYIKFFTNATYYKLQPAFGSKSGYMCVEDMKLGIEHTDEKTGEVIKQLQPIYPTQYKNRNSGAILPVEDNQTWIYFDEETQ